MTTFESLSSSISPPLDLISLVTDKLVRTLDFDQALHILIEGATELLGAERASIMILDKQTGNLSIKVAKGIDDQVIAATRIPLGQGIAGGVAQTGMPLVIEDVRKLARWQDAETGRRGGYEDHSALCVPLVIHGEVEGVMNFNNKNSHSPFGQADLEFAMLIANQAAIALYSAMMHQHFLDKQTIEQELRIAKSIQQRFLPSRPPSVSGFRLAATCVMCSEVGGDYYDFVPLGQDRLAIVVGDVSGHGIPSALLMANARAFLRSCLDRGDAPEHCLYRLNNFLQADSPDDVFMTLVLGLLDGPSRSMSIVNAGHHMPVLIRDARCVPSPKAGCNIPLGIEPNWRFAAENPIHFQRGDMVALFTDGLWEAVNQNDQQFGLDELCRALERAYDQPEEQILEDVVGRVGRHRGSAVQLDDYTLIVLRAL